MKTALIGYTGFVGSNIASQVAFSDYYNSKNIENIRGKKYDLIVSAGATADRNIANQDSKKDWCGINKLLKLLTQVQSKRFVLISTIDVYPKPVCVDENSLISLKLLNQTYGRNRYKMELFVKKHFPKNTIIRCPNLFGINLKKNFIYDLIHNSGLELRHKDSMYQYYPLKYIWKDIQIALINNISLINFAVEPISGHEIALTAMGLDYKNVTESPPTFFDFRTIHGNLYDSSDGYIYHKQRILADIKQFVQEVITV